MIKYLVLYDGSGLDYGKKSYKPNRVVPDLFDTWKSAYEILSEMKRTNDELDYTFYGNLQIVEIEV